ncbi:amino acid ABC transporter permease [Brenneria goodwinii]|uniref:amino acid ABC transporter permease n=1 Tax=Brenneria goodwinii TaxID=1109412 RepID=UPI0036F18CFF
MDMLLEQFLNIEVMKACFPMLVDGLWVTLQLCLLVIPVGCLAGLLTALACLSSRRPLRIGAIIFTDLFRAVPPLVLLILIYSGLPFAGLHLSPMQAVALAFMLNNAAYYGEVLRAGIQSVGRGQREAARSTGLNALQTLLWVVLPQAVRNVLPDLLSNTIEVIKLTSLASVVSLAEILYAADMARSLTYNASPLVLAAGFYLVMIWPLVRLISRFERRVEE